MAFGRDKQIIVGALVLAGLGALVWKQMKQDEAKGTLAPAKVELPSFSVPDDVDKLSITHGDKPEVVLEKKGDKWVVTKPVSAPANQQNVKSAVDNLKEIKIKEVIAPQADDALKKQYELDGAKALHVVAWKGADKKADATFGKSGSRGELTMVEGKPAIYGATGYSSFVFAREVKGWRDTEIFKFDDANATQVTLENKNGSFSFTKGDKWAATAGKEKPTALERFNEEKLKDMLRTMKALNAEDFGDGKPAADTGLDAPEATVIVQLKDNAGKYVLKLGKVSSGSSRYAQKEGDATIFVIGSWVADWLVADTSKFQFPADAGAKDAAAADLKMPPGMGAMPGMPGMPAMPSPHEH